MKKFFCLCILSLMINMLYAQINVTGTIVDESTKKTLQGVNISIAKLNLFSTSDQYGHFQFTISKNGEYTLTVSHVSYKTKDFTISGHDGSNVNLDIHLTPNIIRMDAIEINATTAKENIPVAYSNVSKEVIQSLNTGVDIPKMLNVTPSLIFSTDNGSGIGYSSIKIRGTDMTRINITMNGVPLNNSESQEIYFVDMPDLISSVDNVQIQRGIGTSIDGPAAFGATIDFKTQGIEKNPYSQLTLTGGSFNTLRANIKAGTGLINDKFSMNIGLSKINSDGYIDRAFSNLSSMYLDAGYYGEKVYLKFINVTGKETTYQAWNGASKEQIEQRRQYNPAGEMWINDSLVGFYNNETDNYLLTTNQLIFGYQILQNLKLNATLYYTYGTGYYENYKNNQKLSKYQLNDSEIFTPITPEVKKTNLIRRKWVDSDFLGGIYSLNYNKGVFDFILGGGYNYYNGRHYGKIIWAQKAIVNDINKDWYRNKSDKKDYNQYLKINMAVGANLNIYIDAQYRRVFYKINGLRDDLVDLSQEHTYNFFNPKAGIVWKNDNNRAYLSFALTHREPSRDDFKDADPGKTPKYETLFDYEAGYQHTFNRVKLAASLYYMNYKDQLVLTGMINNTGDPIMINVDKSYRAGMELEGCAEIIKNKLFWNANVTLSQNKIKNFVEYIDDWDNGGQITKEYGTTNISFSPSIIAFNKFQYNFVKNFSVSFTSKYVGKQYMDNSSDQRYSINPYFVNDLRLDYNITMSKLVKNLNVFCAVYNIFNAKYETKAWIYRYYYEDTECFDAGYFPQAGINIMAGITMKF